MSQHRFTTKEHTIVLGWDNPLQTFFAQVWPGHDDDAWEEPLLWVGCLAGELATIDALTGALEPFGEIPEDLWPCSGRITTSETLSEPRSLASSLSLVSRGVLDERTDGVASWPVRGAQLPRAPCDIRPVAATTGPASTSGDTGRSPTDLLLEGHPLVK